MTFEVTEDNLNAYLRAHPEDFAIPDGFDAPRVGFGNGCVEVSALTKLLWVTTRVRVTMAPEVVRGRLRLRVREIHAGPIPLPSSFHRGAADTIAGVVNGILDRNEMQLLSMQVERGLIRATAIPRLQSATEAEPPAQP
jgi:hypothetical protein